MPNTNDTILDSRRNRAAAAFAAIMVAVAGGVVAIVYSEDHTYAEVPYSEKLGPEPTHCWRGTVRGPPITVEALDLKAPPDALILAEVCFYEPPGCENLGAKVIADVKPEDATPVKAEAQEAVAWAKLVQAAKDKTPIEPVEATMADLEPIAKVSIDLCPTRAKVLPAGIESTTGDEEIVPYVKGNPVLRVWVQGHPDAPWRCSCTDSKGTAHPMPCGCWEANCGIPKECCEDEFLDPDGKPVECSVEGKCGHAKACADPALVCVGQRCVLPPAEEPAGVDAGSVKPEGDVKPIEDLVEPTKLEAPLSGGK